MPVSYLTERLAPSLLVLDEEIEAIEGRMKELETKKQEVLRIRTELKNFLGAQHNGNGNGSTPPREEPPTLNPAWPYRTPQGIFTDLVGKPLGVQLRAHLLLDLEAAGKAFELTPTELNTDLTARGIEIDRKTLASALRALALLDPPQLKLIEKGGPGKSSLYRFTKTHAGRAEKYLRHYFEGTVEERVLRTVTHGDFPKEFSVADIVEGLRANGTMNGNAEGSVSSAVHKLVNEGELVKLAGSRGTTCAYTVATG